MSKILIIEDDLVFARALKNWLEKEHFQVEYATNATRARRMITDNGDADLILSDMRLPDGDGVEMLEWLNKRDSRIPFCCYDAICRSTVSCEGYEIGCSGLSAQALYARNSIFGY